MNLTRSIGLSNFNQQQIAALLAVATIRPTVNQCDLSVGGQDTQCGPRDAAIAYSIAQVSRGVQLQSLWRIPTARAAS